VNIAVATINDFIKLFAGNTEAHGVHLYGDSPVEPGKKSEGQSFTVVEKVRDEAYIAHLQGGKGLGIVPVNADGNCKFSVIDVDIYNKDHGPILTAIYSFDMPIVPFRSKSGGLHIYLFYKDWVKASYAIDTMTEFRAVLGLSAKTEIFPKQKKLAEGGVGSWINMPYYNLGDRGQYMLDKNGGRVDIEDALPHCLNHMIENSGLVKFLEELPISDGPPCLQSIFLKKTTSFRNNYLFGVSTYYKAKIGDDFPRPVEEANLALDDPIDLKELMNTVIGSQKKKVYSYKCSEEPICNICSKAVCKKRKFGISSNEISELSFGDFVQYRSSPPMYTWELNGKRIRFFSEEDMIYQDRFRKMCLRELHIFPSKLSDPAWTKILNTALSNIIVKEESLEETMSDGSLFMDHLTEFLTKRAPAVTKAQIVVDRVFYDHEMDAYIFRARNLVTFLLITKQFRTYGLVELQEKLKDMGAKPVQYTVDPLHKNVRVWAMPREALARFVEDRIDNVEVDFLEEVKDVAF
jgi:hypothetical protein